MSVLVAPSITQKTLDFAALPNDRWPGRLIVGGQTLDDFVVIGEEPSSEASWTTRVFQFELFIFLEEVKRFTTPQRCGKPKQNMGDERND